MAIIVISHPSNFAAYLLAATILLYYEHQSRSLKIVIVEDFAANRGGIQDFKPWCGVNTLSNPRFQYGDFMVRELLNRLLLANRDLGIVPLDLSLIHIWSLRFSLCYSTCWYSHGSWKSHGSLLWTVLSSSRWASSSSAQTAPRTEPTTFGATAASFHVAVVSPSCSLWI